MVVRIVVSIESEKGNSNPQSEVSGGDSDAECMGDI